MPNPDCKDITLTDAVIPIDVPEEPAEGFRSLKDTLGTIPAAYIDHEVRLRFPAQYPPLTNTSIGNRCRQEQDPDPPLTRSFAGCTFFNTSK